LPFNYDLHYYKTHQKSNTKKTVGVFDFSVDEYGTVSIEDGNGEGFQTINIPQDCLKTFISVLEEYK